MFLLCQSVDKISINDIPVYGVELNQQTGCAHYHSPLDNIALLFKCCKRYYACYYCHQADADHEIERWQPHEWDTRAILCSACGKELTIHQYFACNMRCVHCHAAFNPGCKTHWHFYFVL